MLGLPLCCPISQPPVIRVSISLVKVMIMPPARVRNPLDRWLGSWLWRESPTWTIPQPSRIIPTARMRPKIKSDSLLMTVRGVVAGLSGKGCHRKSAQQHRRQCQRKINLVLLFHVAIPPLFFKYSSNSSSVRSRRLRFSMCRDSFPAFSSSSGVHCRAAMFRVSSP